MFLPICHVLSVASASICYFQLHSEAQNLAQKETKLRLSQDAAANADVVEANAKLEQIMLRFQESTLQKGKDDEIFSMRDGQAAIAAVVEEYATKPVASITSGDATVVELEGEAGDAEPLRVGEQVMVKRLGKRAATVVEIPQAENDYLTVQAGTMKLRVKLNEIVSRVSSAEKEGARNSLGKKPKVIRVKHLCCERRSLLFDRLLPVHVFWHCNVFPCVTILREAL